MQVIAYRENGDTSNIERVFLYKDSGATAGTEGDPITGLTNASTGLNISTIAHNEATANIDTSAATSSIETVTTLGTYSTPTAGFVRFREVDATNTPGLYEIQWENARYAVTNGLWLDVCISGVADLATFHGRIYTNAIPASGNWNVGKTGYALTTANWNVGKTGYTLTPTTGLGAQTANITGNLSGSVGSVTGAVGSVTGAVGSVTGHTAQTGDSFARIGATGSGLTSLAQASVLGALATAAATGDPTSAKTIMGYIKQLVNTIVGTAGIATFPAESAPGNAVSLAEVIRAIHADVTGLNGAAMRGTDGANTATPLTAAGVRTAVGLAAANMDTQFAASATATGFATEAKQDAQDLIITEARLAELDAGNLPADIAAIPTVAEILTTQMTESYAADGAAPTLAQALMLIQQMLGDFTISGTTMTVRQVDGVTAAATFTLNNGTTPTALTRAT